MCKADTGSKNMNYDVTLAEAEKNFCAGDFMLMADRAGAERVHEGQLKLKFIGQEYFVDEKGQISVAVGSEDTSLAVKILILHYLVNAEGIPVQNKPISFKELPGGAIYITPFTNRAIRPLTVIFGANPAGLINTGKLIGAEPVKMGDAAIKVSVFPNVPVTLVLWGGDEEFPPSGNILFDISASAYLPTEDFAVLASMLVLKLKALKV